MLFRVSYIRTCQIAYSTLNIQRDEIREECQEPAIVSPECANDSDIHGLNMGGDVGKEVLTASALYPV